MKKRDGVKWIRDKAKSSYNKGTECYICGTTENLDFHHFNSIAELYHSWVKKNGFNPKTDEDALELRDQFIEEHYDEMYNRTVTICNAHHTKLHKIYGKNPNLSTAKKQERWVEKQRCKHLENES